MSTRRIHLFLASAICCSSTLYPLTKQISQNHYQIETVGKKKVSETDQRYGVSLYGDFLYWKPYFSNTPYVLQGDRLNQSTPRPDGITDIIYKPTILDFHANVGFRLGALYSDDWHNISFAVDWTRFHTQQRIIKTNDRLTSTSSGDLGNPDILDPFWGANSTITLGTNFKLSSNQVIKIDQLDFLFSTLFDLNDWLSTRPGGGIRAYLSTVSFKNTFTKNFNNRSRAFEPPFNGSTEDVAQRYYSVGALMSLYNEFKIYSRLSLINDLQLGFLVGNCKNTTTLTSHGASDAPGNTGLGRVDTLVENAITIKPVFDVDLGLQYDYLNAAKTFGFFLQLAYEAHILPDFVQFIYLRDTTAQHRVFSYRGDLIFQGMRARFGVSF